MCHVLSWSSAVQIDKQRVETVRPAQNDHKLNNLKAALLAMCIPSDVFLILWFLNTWRIYLENLDRTFFETFFFFINLDNRLNILLHILPGRYSKSKRMEDLTVDFSNLNKNKEYPFRFWKLPQILSWMQSNNLIQHLQVTSNYCNCNIGP